MDLSPFHRDRPRGYRPAHWGPELTPLQLAQQCIEMEERAQNPFLQMPTGYVDLIHAILGGNSILQIIVTGGRLHHFIQFGVCTIYAYGRVEPYLRRRLGGTRKGGTRKHRTLKPNELAIIEVHNPTEQFIRKLEREIGKARMIDFDDLTDQ